MKKILRVLLILVLVIVAGVCGLLGWLTATEDKPAAVEPVETMAAYVRMPSIHAEGLTVLSWNIGYAGLCAESDFFMDGG